MKGDSILWSWFQRCWWGFQETNPKTRCTSEMKKISNSFSTGDLFEHRNVLICPCAHLSKAERAGETAGQRRGSVELPAFAGNSCGTSRSCTESARWCSTLDDDLPGQGNRSARGDLSWWGYRWGRGRSWHNCCTLPSENNMVSTPYRALWTTHKSRLWEGQPLDASLRGSQRGSHN